MFSWRFDTRPACLTFPHGIFLWCTLSPPPPPHTDTYFFQIQTLHGCWCWYTCLILTVLSLHWSYRKASVNWTCFFLTKHRYSPQLTYFSIPITCISVVHTPHYVFSNAKLPDRNCNVMWRNIVSRGLLSAKKNDKWAIKSLAVVFFTASRLGTSQFTAYWLLLRGLVFFSSMRMIITLLCHVINNCYIL